MTAIGIDTYLLLDFIDTKKLYNFLQEELQGMHIPQDVNIEDLTHGQPYCCLGEVFALLDNSDTLTFDGNYLFYPQSFPWERTDNEPQTIEDVHNNIIKAVQKLVDLEEEQIDEFIDNAMHICEYWNVLNF